MEYSMHTNPCIKNQNQKEKIKCVLSNETNVKKIREMHDKILVKFGSKKAIYAARIEADNLCKKSSIKCNIYPCTECITDEDIKNIIM